MKSKILMITASSLLLLGSCNKKEEDTTPKDFGELKTRVIFNFAEDVALKAFSNLNNAVIKMASQAENYYYSGSTSDFEILKQEWQNANKFWELTESFQFGPITTGTYASKMDTWPARPAEFDALLAGSNNLEVPDIENLSNNLRGFHAMEYVLFGANGRKTANAVDWKQRKYLLNLAKDLRNNSVAIFNAWTAGAKSYGSEIIHAGKGSSAFTTKQSLFSAMVTNMGNMCSKIAIDNLGKPFDNMDSLALESPYANQSLSDIQTNLQSLQLAYTGQYNGSNGYGIRDLVKDKRNALDVKLSERMKLADSALAQIKTSLDSAVIYKRMETKTAIDAVDSLRSTLQNELLPFIQENITD